jgi:hypothetical protein
LQRRVDWRYTFTSVSAVCTASAISSLIALLMEAVRTSETPVNLQQSIWCYTPENSHLPLRSILYAFGHINDPCLSKQNYPMVAWRQDLNNMPGRDHGNKSHNPEKQFSVRVPVKMFSEPWKLRPGQYVNRGHDDDVSWDRDRVKMFFQYNDVRWQNGSSSSESK